MMRSFKLLARSEIPGATRIIDPFGYTAERQGRTRMAGNLMKAFFGRG